MPLRGALACEERESEYVTDWRESMLLVIASRIAELESQLPTLRPADRIERLGALQEYRQSFSALSREGPLVSVSAPCPATVPGIGQTRLTLVPTSSA